MVQSDEVPRILAELQQARKRLARAEGLITLGHVAAQAAHKLNSCLAVIQGYAQLLLEEELDDETKATIRKIDQEAQKAAEVVAQLADLAKQERESGSENASLGKALAPPGRGGSPSHHILRYILPPFLPPGPSHLPYS